MATRTITLTYGKGTREYRIDEGFLAGDPIAPRKVAAAKRPPLEVIREALESPVGRPRLRDMVKGKRVCVVVSDDFRAGLQVPIGEALLEEVAAGTPSKVTLLVATGSHAPDVYAKRIVTALREAAKRIGIDVEFPMHDTDTSKCVEVGTTPLGTRVIVDEAYLRSDVRVYGHEAKHHYMAGYSCIDKQVIPGVSMRKTIEMNHKLSLDADSRAGNSPYHDDPRRQRNLFVQDARDGRHLCDRYALDQAGKLVSARIESFGLDMISEKEDILWVLAGDPDQVTRRMPAQADKFGAFEVDKARYVVISPGGPPACQALYGVQNCFDMALLGAIQDNGEALIVAPCDGRPDLPPEVSGIAPDEKAKQLFYDNLVRLLPEPLEACEAFVRDNFELYLWKTMRVLRLYKKHGLKLYLHSELGDERVKAAGLTPVRDPQAWIDERAARKDGRCHVIDGGNKLFVGARA